MTRECVLPQVGINQEKARAGSRNQASKGEKSKDLLGDTAGPDRNCANETDVRKSPAESPRTECSTQSG